MKAYVTCPISKSKERLNLLPEIKSILENQDIDCFVIKEREDTKEIFDRDYEESDLIIAEVSETSHGVGIEIDLSYCLGLKRILLLKKGEYLSRMAQGIPNTIVIEYENIEDLKSKLSNELSRIKETNKNI